jgi:hypothetical protein
MDMLKLSEKVPVFIRWLLLFPVYLLITLVIGLIIRITVIAGGLPLPVFNLIFPPMMAVISLFVLYHIAPAIKLKLLIVLITLRALLIPLFIFGFCMHFKGADIDISWGKWWSPFVGEILTLIASIWFYRLIRKDDQSANWQSQAYVQMGRR